LFQLQHFAPHKKTAKTIATRHVSLHQNVPKTRLRRGSAPDPTGGAYSAPPDPLAGLRGRFSVGREGKERGEGGKEGQGTEGR